MAILNPDGSQYTLSPTLAGLLSPDAVAAANSLYAADNVNPTMVRAGVSDLVSAQSEANTANAQAEASNLQAQGYDAESGAYANAGMIADQNARIARVSGQLQQYQAGREAYKTISGQMADIAGAGFGNAGTALDLFRSSRQQLALNKQLIGTQAAITAGGFEQEAAASKAEVAATGVAAASARALAAQAAGTGQMLQANALNNAMSLLATPTDPTTGLPLGPTATTGASATGASATSSLNGAPTGGMAGSAAGGGMYSAAFFQQQASALSLGGNPDGLTAVHGYDGKPMTNAQLAAFGGQILQDPATGQWQVAPSGQNIKGGGGASPAANMMPIRSF